MSRLFHLTISALLITILAVLFWVPSNLSFPESRQPILEKALVQVDGVCTGWLAFDDIIVTAAHCIRGDMDDIYFVEFWDHKIDGFKLVYMGTPGTETDIAILVGDTRDIEPFEIALKKPGWMTYIYSLGYGPTPHQWTTDGLYIEKACTKTGCEHYLGLRAIPGDSGGPVLNNEGKVFGIIHSSFWPYGIGISIAAPTTKLIQILTDLNLY